MPDRDWWSVLWPDPDDVLLRLGVRGDMHALDLCCGDGYFTASLARLTDGNVSALDLDPRMIDLARREVADRGTAVRQWIVGDAFEIAGLLGEPVDFVFMANTFHGVPDQPRLCREIASILNSGGRAAIVGWRPYPREETVVLGKSRGPDTSLRQSPDILKRLFEEVGLRHHASIELPPYHYGIVFVKTEWPGESAST